MQQLLTASVHRTMNERNQQRSSADATSMRCECECHRMNCASSFRISMFNYDEVRANGRFFVVAPGHGRFSEPVVSRSDLYLVVEQTGTQGLSAEQLDPRNNRSRGNLADTRYLARKIA